MQNLNVSTATRALLETEIEQQALPREFMHTIEHWLVPVAARLNELHSAKGDMLLVSFNGSQGSGKSTQTRFLSLLLRHHFGLNSIDISIDDFYLTHAERQRLGREVHPLFVTRGVPGTHDVQLARDTFDCLRQASIESPCRLPRFDKSVDDRAALSEWSIVDAPVDVLLFEGWCNHAPVQSESQLATPVNALEASEDPDMTWRRHANEALRQYHEQLFDQADLLIHLKIPGFDSVYEWRGLQEQKLAAKSAGAGKAVMDDAALRRFIHHYERITRACLDQLPKQAQIVIELDRDHQITSISFNEDDVSTV
jgi:D-glycerate 3-kinase